MAHVLHLQRTFRGALDDVRATIHDVVRAIAAEHTRALRAATKAASPRQSLAEVRAMYVPPEPQQRATDARGSEAHDA